MYNLELIQKINKIAEEISPNLQLEFMSNKVQMDTFYAYIRIAFPVLTDRCEIMHNLHDRSAIKNLLKMRIKNTLMQMKDFAQEELERL